MPIALLVVPSYHGQAPMDKISDFLGWLREERDQGTEIFLHGYHHWMAELVGTESKACAGSTFPGKRTAWGKWVNRNLVSQEAEFCGLSPSDQARYLDLGIACMQRAGIAPAGFVAPTWHGSPPLRILRERGIPRCESRFFLHDLKSGGRRFAPPLAWNPNPEGGEPILFGGKAWLQLMLRMPLIKAAIHPGDLEGESVFKVVSLLNERGAAVSYSEVFQGSTPVTSAQKVPI